MLLPLQLHRGRWISEIRKRNRESGLFVFTAVDFQDGKESFLRDVDLADALHALFAFFLFFEEFAFAEMSPP